MTSKVESVLNNINISVKPIKENLKKEHIKNPSPNRDYRKRRRKRRKSKTYTSSRSLTSAEDYGKGLRPRRRNERRHRPLWDILPPEAEEMNLLKGLPINIGQTGDFMHADRAGRRVYVGNLPLQVKENAIREFFNTVMVAAQGPNRKPGASVLGVFLNLKKRFAFIEFRSAVEATQAMDLDGIMFQGLSLKMGRPANYNASAASIASRHAPKLNLSKLGIVSSHVPNGPNKLYIGGLPYNLDEKQVRELLETYGSLRGLFLSFDPVTGLSKGYAFAYYEDEAVTDAAIEGLNAIQIGDKILQVRRHESCQKYESLAMKTDMIEVSGNEVQPTECIVLMQMITSNDLNDPEELEDIKADIRSECGNYGTVIDLVIPNLNQPGAGKVYLKYSSVSEAQVAKNALQGRSFGDSTVICTFYDVEKFNKKQFI